MKHVRETRVGILDTIFLGISGVSPALSISAALATLIVIAGKYAPLSIALAGLLMFGIVLSFAYLHEHKRDDGTSYVWVSKIFGKKLGYATGWSILSASVLYLVSAAPPVASGILRLFSESTSTNDRNIGIVGTILLASITYIVFRGIKFASQVDTITTVASLVSMLAIVSASWWYFIVQNIPFPSLLFTASSFSYATLFSGVLIAVFLFWGWDVMLSVGEESKLTKRKAIAYSTIVLCVVAALAIFSLGSLIGTFSHEYIVAAGPRILFDAAELVLPKPFATIAVLSILISSVGAIEASIIQFVKTLFAMSRDGVVDVRLSLIHDRRGTPWVALLLIGGSSILVFLLSLLSHTANEIIQSAIAAICLQVIFYYSVTAFACVWTYRKKWNHVPTFIFALLWPMLSASALLVVGWMSITTFSSLTNVLGLGTIAGGLLYAFVFVK